MQTGFASSVWLLAVALLPAFAQEEKGEPAVVVSSGEQVSGAALTGYPIEIDVRGRGDMEMQLEVLEIIKGKSKAVTQTRLLWKKVPKPSYSVRGTILLLVQDGAPFGKEGKEIVSTGSSFDGQQPTVVWAGAIHFFDKRETGFEHSTKKQALSPGKTHVLVVRGPVVEAPRPFTVEGLTKGSNTAEKPLLVLTLKWVAAPKDK
jgi:hypothetical protein